MPKKGGLRKLKKKKKTIIRARKYSAQAGIGVKTNGTEKEGQGKKKYPVL